MAKRQNSNVCTGHIFPEIFPWQFPTVTKFPDTFLTAIKFPTISRFSRQVVTMLITNRKETHFNCMYGFQRMLYNCSSIFHFTLVDLHVTIGCNQCPCVGNIAGRHVSMADMLTNHSVYLVNNKASHLTVKPALALRNICLIKHQLLTCKFFYIYQKQYLNKMETFSAKNK